MIDTRIVIRVTFQGSSRIHPEELQSALVDLMPDATEVEIVAVNSRGHMENDIHAIVRDELTRVLSDLKKQWPEPESK